MTKNRLQLQLHLDILEAPAAPLSATDAGMGLLRKAVDELAESDEVDEVDRPWLRVRLQQLCQRHRLPWEEPTDHGPSRAALSAQRAD